VDEDLFSGHADLAGLFVLSVYDAISNRCSDDCEKKPTYWKAPKAAAPAAASILASSSTINGAFPPNSRTTGLRYLPQIVATFLPTIVEPVKFTFFTAGLAINASVTDGASSLACEIRFTTPGGKPAL
jgi:hypothetical protein